MKLRLKIDLLEIYKLSQKAVEIERKVEFYPDHQGNVDWLETLEIRGTGRDNYHSVCAWGENQRYNMRATYTRESDSFRVTLFYSSGEISRDKVAAIQEGERR